MRKNALYLRLSLADGDLGKNNKDESNSIENQRTLLVNFLQDRDDLADEYIEYVDDGYTGTNFERPEFKRMIEDAKTGKIDTIIVKDFSRFGRDYIGVGDYLEQILPILGIRFISVNNNYDSKKVLYPKAWIHNFGETTNRTVFLQRIAYKGNWEILRPAKTVEGMEIITREILDDLIDEAEKLIDRMRCATYE